ncbi:MAG: hypothetical protein GF401_19555 [Chitinivibrionales bacterium]|nr:hypothetical protein [Chitinivibrionales bacterium]
MQKNIDNTIESIYYVIQQKIYDDPWGDLGVRKYINLQRAKRALQCEINHWVPNEMISEWPIRYRIIRRTDTIVDETSQKATMQPNRETTL